MREGGARFQDHGDEEGARELVANLNVGVEEQHMSQPLAQGDVLVYDAEHMCTVALRVCVCMLLEFARLAAAACSSSCLYTRSLLPFRRRTKLAVLLLL